MENNAMNETTEAALYLIPVTLGGDVSHDQVLPAHNREVILSLRHFIVEELRTARRFLKQVEKTIDIDSLHFCEMGKHADPAVFSRHLEPLRRGESVGVLSEAGCPAVADPGADIVAIAQREGLRVVPLVGPSSILLAVMGSGFNGQSFAFNGYLPVDAADRSKTLKKLEARSAAERQTQLFIETPFRNLQLFRHLLASLDRRTRLCVAAGLTTEAEFLRTLTVAQWKGQPEPPIHKVPTIFAIYAGGR
ncbi:MAG: SAM-dependent methyltransferase [Alloprevotella sp.]